MFGQIAGALIGAGASYLGQKKANQQAANQAAGNAALQREFAQQGIRWRVEDAKAAGIHPLYALGASVPTYSPVSASFGNTASDFAQAGQNIGRAIDSTRTQAERDEATELAFYRKKRAQLENDLLREQIRASRVNNPPSPSANGDPNKAEEVVGRSNPATGLLPEKPQGWNFRISPGMTGGDAEEEYGEFGGSAYGAGKFVWDAGKNFGRWKLEGRERRGKYNAAKPRPRPPYKRRDQIHRFR